MKLRNWLLVMMLLPLWTWASTMTPEQRKEGLLKLDWQTGPGVDQIADKASLKVPSKDFLFLDDKDSRRFLELTGNLPEDGNYVLVNQNKGWWSTFSFDPIGYVKDDEKIDADALLEKIKELEETANEERQRQGMSPLFIDGWSVPPHYDANTKLLEWGLKVHSKDGASINYTIRFLGRTGVISATLISSPETLDTNVANFRKILQGFEFNSGERYAEFKEGDKIAEYGLAALIVGGAAAIATKKGFWAAAAIFLAKAWKLIAIGAAAVAAGLRSFFKRKQQKRQDN